MALRRYKTDQKGKILTIKCMKRAATPFTTWTLIMNFWSIYKRSRGGGGGSNLDGQSVTKRALWQIYTDQNLLNFATVLKTKAVPVEFRNTADGKELSFSEERNLEAR